MVTNQLMAGDCRMLCEEHCSYETRCLVSHPCVMTGRRLAVGFLQIVPGVFPTGVVTDRLLITAAKGKRPNMPYAYTRYFTPNAMLKSRQIKGRLMPAKA
ncbi:hypothetical protein [Oligosphaera ethanolica]|uniref:Uncharacterized protein n=1 Tax=Oligosphaera ethanolica TaxID=760260 RepID=A0AAE3VJX5_9BACT|nr:hypothetical protein [Oligosphaera ethanolica]MDQ0291691.1 hypothetical protein [Oligosphaera ethanolica]